jgi:hypothetical protein
VADGRATSNRVLEYGRRPTANLFHILDREMYRGDYSCCGMAVTVWPDRTPPEIAICKQCLKSARRRRWL